MNFYKRFKKRFRVLHLLLVSSALVLSWWGLWGILDTYLIHLHIWGYLIAIGMSFAVLYLDYNVKELE